MVHLKIFEIVENGSIFKSKCDYSSITDLLEEIEFFERMIATKWKLVITFD